MADNFEYDVFLSHNAQDKPRVRQLAERLKQAGLRVWFDEWNIKPGEIISLKVDQGLKQSRALALCISPNALASGWVELERSTAIHRDLANEGRRFVPLLLDDCELPNTLRRYKYVDFRANADVAFGEILAACRPEVIEVPSSEKSGTERNPKKKKVTGVKSERTEPLAVFERELRGHNARVGSIAVSPDGKWLVSGAGDWKSAEENVVKIWNLNTGECTRTMGHDDSVRSVAISRNGEILLTSAIQEKTIRVWDTRTWELRASWPIHKWGATSLAPLFDNNLVFSSGAGVTDSILRLFTIDSGKCIRSFIGHTAAVLSASVSANGKRGLSGSADHTVRLWDLHTGNCLATLRGHSERVRSVEITADGRVGISNSADETIKIWDLEARRCIGTLEDGPSWSVALSPDGTLIASASIVDQLVRLWDWRLGSSLQVIRYHKRNFKPVSLAFSPDGTRLVVGTVTGAIFVYRITIVRPTHATETPHRYVNAKIVLIGESTVGKTTLAHRLIEDRYVKTDSTHGMNVWRLELPLPPDEMVEREALLWDLAGQMGYREIHKLFLDQTALALLLINPQKDDPFSEAGDWLKALKPMGDLNDPNREVAKLLITTRSDVGGVMVSDKKISRFIEDNDFKAWLSTGAKSGENCSDIENGGQPSKLKQLIAEAIPWDSLPWTSTPQLLAELKNALVAMRDERDIRLLRFAELVQRLEQALPGEKFGESDVRTAVTLLANHGLARPLNFGDLVLLQPELLNGYAGAIIRAARAHTDEIGSVLEADIYKPDFDFTGVERLKNRPDEELLLRALIQIFLDNSLCIAEDTPYGRHLVFPSQYRREKDIPRDPDIFVSYTFSGEWQTVWTTLVVRLWYSHEFEHRELWRNAADFASGKGHTLGMKIDNKQGEGVATISLYFDVQVPDELKAIFIEYVHRHLAKFGCEVSRDRRYVCPECGKPVKDLDTVRKRLDAKKDFITCQACDERVPLIDFIEQRLKSDPVARKILAMDATATRELDTQALEQILIGHMMATCGEANQIFRPTTMFDYGIDGEVEFKDNDGKASGKRIYIQLKSGNSYLRKRKSDGSEVFDVKNERHLDYWISHPVDVYLVIRQTDEATGAQTIRWMNVTRYLKERKDKKSRQIIFAGEKLDMEAVWKVRDQFFPPSIQRRK